MNEAYKTKKFDFDRYPIQLSEVLLHTPASIDVIVSRTSEKWEYLRKVTHRASNKFAASESLPTMIVPIVDQLIDDIKQNERPFNPQDKISTLVYRILGSMISGHTMNISDKTVSDIMKSFLYQIGIAHKLLFIEYIPTLRKTIFRKDWNKLVSAYRYVSNWCYDRISDRMSQYANDATEYTTISMEQQSGNKIHSFSDELIRQKINNDIKYNNDFIDMDNMTNVAMNMFIAGSNSTSITISWVLLFMCKYPDIQIKLRNEIYSYIADDAIPNAENMKLCNYTQAFISEVLRMCPVLPISLPHITTRDTIIAGKSIPKDTMIIQSLIHALYDINLWNDPHTFNPERFIDQETGLYNKNIPGYVPFSMGHRLCIGERMAYVNLYIIIARILQKTKGYMFKVEDENSIDINPDPKHFEYKPIYFELRLVKRIK